MAKNNERNQNGGRNMTNIAGVDTGEAVGTAGGAAAGAAVGSAFGPLGTVAGAVAGGANAKNAAGTEGNVGATNRTEQNK